MAPPPKIYKYREPNERSFRNLSESVLWVSAPKAFNDPFDLSLPAIDRIVAKSMKSVTPDQCRDILRGFVKENERRVRRDRRRMVRDTPDVDIVRIAEQVIRKSTQEALKYCKGICCFSEDGLSPQMWAHYAKQYSGFCIEFDTSLPPFADTNGKGDILHPVKYHKEIPPLDIPRMQRGDSSFILDYPCMKLKGWEYEAEWRIIHGRANFPLSYDPRSVTGIFIGTAMAKEHIAKIKEIFAGTVTQLRELRVGDDLMSFVTQPMLPCD